MTEFKTSTYRFQFSHPFVALLKEFALRHRHDDTVQFKEAWDEWSSINIFSIKAEKKRLERQGYPGDIEDKMYKSVRYYFKNKSYQEKTQKKRGQYISFKKKFLTDMDQHIREVALIQCYKPSHAFNNFYGNHRYNKEMLLETRRMLNLGLDEVQIESKIKKTYKNRYYVIQHK